MQVQFAAVPEAFTELRQVVLRLAIQSAPEEAVIEATADAMGKGVEKVADALMDKVRGEFEIHTELR